MAGKIFINYRRGDDPGNTGRLFDRLQEVFSPDRLFMDVDSIEPGLDFVQVLQEQVAQCDVLISVIGKGWLDARDDTGMRRLDNSADFVRIEIEAALAQDKRVIPVLVGDARLPRADELPDALKPLARRNAARLTHERFRADVQGLIGALQRALEQAEDVRKAEAAKAEAWRQAELEERRKREDKAEARRKAEDERRFTEAEAERRAQQELRARQAERVREAERQGAEASGAGDSREDKRGKGPTLVALPRRAWLIGGGAVGVAVVTAVIWMLVPAPHSDSPQPTSVAQTLPSSQPAPSVPPPSPAAQPDPAPSPTPQQASANTSAAAIPLSFDRERALKAGNAFSECDKCPEMIVVPTGRFTMGSPDKEPGRHNDEGPQHDVRFDRPFAVGRFHVSVDQFRAFVTETGYDAGSQCYQWTGSTWELKPGSWRNPGFTQDVSHPVVCVNWKDAKAYVAWLAKKTGKPYRLLSEAEFEYAARAKTTPGAYPRFWFGNEEKDMCRYGNGADETAKSQMAVAKDWAIAPCSDGYAYTSPVGKFAANDFGLFDMSGNAWQWTEDCYHDNYTGAPDDGRAWATVDCDHRVVRGGSWLSNPQYLRSANRNWLTTVSRDYYLGFRVGRTLTP